MKAIRCMESQSNAGKWILTVLAFLVVAVFGYAHYMTYTTVEKLTKDMGASQAQTKELQNRMQDAEETEQTLARQAGIDQAGTGAKDRRVACAAESR